MHGSMRRIARACGLPALALTLTCGAVAHGEEPPAMTPEQQAMMEAYQKAGAPGPPHEALAAQVGSYDVMVKNWQDPAGEPVEEAGSAERTMILDGRVMVEIFHGSMMGMPFTGHGMSGYDNVTGKYWSTWMDSMSTGMMLSEGSCDENDVCTFEGSWNDPITKGPVHTRMTTRWTSPDVEIFEMYGPGPDGAETKMMEITYTRKK